MRMAYSFPSDITTSLPTLKHKPVHSNLLRFGGSSPFVSFGWKASILHLLNFELVCFPGESCFRFENTCVIFKFNTIRTRREMQWCKRYFWSEINKKSTWIAFFMKYRCHRSAFFQFEQKFNEQRRQLCFKNWFTIDHWTFRSPCEWQFIHFALIYSLSNANGNIWMWCAFVLWMCDVPSNWLWLVGASSTVIEIPFFSAIRLFMMFSFSESSQVPPPRFLRVFWQRLAFSSHQILWQYFCVAFYHLDGWRSGLWRAPAIHLCRCGAILSSIKTNDSLEHSEFQLSDVLYFPFM